jgi:hypothetical protein
MSDDISERCSKHYRVTVSGDECVHCATERLIRAVEREAIAFDLMNGAGEARARGTTAWEESMMPIYRELAERYRRGDHLK